MVGLPAGREGPMVGDLTGPRQARSSPWRSRDRDRRRPGGGKLAWRDDPRRDCRCARDAAPRGPRLSPLRAAAAARRAAGAARRCAGARPDRGPGARHARARHGHPVERPERRPPARLAAGGPRVVLRRAALRHHPGGTVLPGPRSLGRPAAAAGMCAAAGTRGCGRCCRRSSSPCWSGSTRRPTTSAHAASPRSRPRCTPGASTCPEFLPLPHPSPRNTRWLQVNPWFARDVLPELRARIEALAG